MIADQVRLCSLHGLIVTLDDLLFLYFSVLWESLGRNLPEKNNQNGGVRMVREEGLAAASMASPMCQAPISRSRSISGIVV